MGIVSGLRGAEIYNCLFLCPLSPASGVSFRFFPECVESMQDINPITHKIADLKGRCQALRGYL
jgi:hypothetical protein